MPNFRCVALILVAFAGVALGSPRGVEFTVGDRTDMAGAVGVSFSPDRAVPGLCYALVNTMGKTVAAACKTPEGWNLYGAESWVVSTDGKLTAGFADNPQVTLIYAEEASRVKKTLGAEGWSDVFTSHLEKEARAACRERVDLPNDGEVKISSSPEGRAVFFMGSDGNGGEFCRAMVLFDPQTEEVLHVAVP